jgi:bifunctional UDP-N-acetylglucosamine pyrophosphorylase/glucosamine-1-phosphate N-acetyltransferase
MSSFCVVILAAGEGKRMKSSLPKVMHEVAGKPMVNHVVDAARPLKPQRIIVVIGRERPQVRTILAKDVRAVFQEKPLGTAHAVKAAIKDIPATARDIMVLYGDTPLVTPDVVCALYESHRTQSASCTVLTTYLDHPRGYGRMLRNDADQVIGIVEDKDATAAQKLIREVNTGMYCFRKDDLLNALAHVQASQKSGEFYLTDVVSWLFHRGQKVSGCVADDAQEVLGVNSQRELAEASCVVRRRVVESHIAAGVTIVDPVTTFIDPSARIGPGTKVYPFTCIEKDVVVGRDCSLGPFCHLREQATLEDGCSIGNFTEIKNSKLGAGTFMRHMSYLGDTTVGKKVNIGAGTVVANFDGKNKNKTVIKDGAFIGCDAVLVAPVVIGKKALVGAGSVVTRQHHVADGATVVGVPARELKKKKH